MKKSVLVFFVIIVGLCMSSCHSEEKSFNLSSTSEIMLTSESGAKMAKQKNISFEKGVALGTVIRIEPEIVKQTMDGIGSSFTESSAFVLAHLDRMQRHDVLENAFGESGANFSMARTHIGACDFCVDGKYSYADVADDTGLEHFTLTPDRDGFDPGVYPDIVDRAYDLLPMIKEALAIKEGQKDATLRIVASAWTAPKWMKDIEEWYIPGTPENNYHGTGGSLKEEYIPVYAEYLQKYLESCKKEGVDIWGLTPVNEPHGNNGQWESMHFTPQSQNVFIKKHLGPKLKSNGHGDVRLLIYDQNRDGMKEWANVILGDSETKSYVYGTAVHWYESTFKVYEDVFDAVREKFPDHAIIHTEGCIDDLGKEAPQGIADPDGFRESGWFDNDAFWWNANATDWAYTASWAPNRDDHPVYVPVHRYARNIIVSIDHWLQGWIDWNLVLDRNGGPNHVGNFCGAPIMVDTKTKYVYYTPIYYVLAQLSRTIRPGDVAVQTHRELNGLDADALHTCATMNADRLLSVQLLNTTKNPIEYKLQIGEKYAPITIDANSIQTVRVQLTQ